jgi:hypothetical protein
MHALLHAPLQRATAWGDCKQPAAELQCHKERDTVHTLLRCNRLHKWKRAVQQPQGTDMTLLLTASRRQLLLLLLYAGRLFCCCLSAMHNHS